VICKGIVDFNFFLNTLTLSCSHWNGISSFILFDLLMKDERPIRFLLESTNEILSGNLEKITDCCISLVVSMVLVGLVLKVKSIRASFTILAKLKGLSSDISHNSLFINILLKSLQFNLTVFKTKVFKRLVSCWEMHPAQTGEQ